MIPHLSWGKCSGNEMCKCQVHNFVSSENAYTCVTQIPIKIYNINVTPQKFPYAPS
jgi:hypothetical protein